MVDQTRPRLAGPGGGGSPSTKRGFGLRGQGEKRVFCGDEGSAAGLRHRAAVVVGRVRLPALGGPP